VSGGIGVIGDSDSDEYAFYPPDRTTARNYVQLLATLRGLNFGAYTTVPRPAPRGAGYAFNWARSGDTSSRMMADGQVAGVAAQVAAHKVATVIICIGSNDLHQALTAGKPAVALESLARTLASNITSTVNKLHNAWNQVKVVVATVPDLGLLPGIKAQKFSTSVLAALTKATGEVNARIEALAAANSFVAVADVATELQTMTATPTVTVGGVKINTRVTGDNINHLFLADGMHYGTVLQGLLANVFVQAMDTTLGSNIRPLTSAEIISAAKA
jgi:phospholipase/lecithinase/hemolysin